MVSFKLSSVLVSLALLGSVTAQLTSTEEKFLDACESTPTTTKTMIGKDRSVLKTVHGCPAGAPKRRVVQEARAVDPTNVCGAPCTTHCFNPAGGGPNPNDCTVITDALLFESQSAGNGFTMAPALNTSMITLKYNTCETFILDQTSGNLTYCLTDWSTLVNDLAFGCQAQQNAHGGLCVANDGRWFVQVQTVGA